MIEAKTRERLHVLDQGVGGPYIRTPLSRIPEIRKLLDEHHIRYDVNDIAISLDGELYIVVVNFGRKADGAAIQAILDTIN